MMKHFMKTKFNRLGWRLLLASLIALPPIVGAQVAVNRASQSDMLEAQSLRPDLAAQQLLHIAQNYVSDNYYALLEGRDVVKGLVVLKAGSGVGQSLAPTPDQLNALGYSTTAGLVPNGTVNIRIVSNEGHGSDYPFETKATFNGVCKTFPKGSGAPISCP